MIMSMKKNPTMKLIFLYLFLRSRILAEKKSDNSELIFPPILKGLATKRDFHGCGNIEI